MYLTKSLDRTGPPMKASTKSILEGPSSPISHHFYGICCYLKLADTIPRYKNRNLKPKNRIGRLKNRNSKRTDTIGRYKNRNLASTDCIVRYNRKIESVSENRSIGPFAHLWVSPSTRSQPLNPSHFSLSTTFKIKFATPFNSLS